MPDIDTRPADDFALQVLCEDGPVLAVNKPAGLLTQGVPAGGIPTLEQAVRDYIRVRYNKPGNVYLGIPHRLDRPVSGVIVFARNSKAAARLAEQFRERKVCKIYWAVCTSAPQNASGELTDWLLKDAAAANVTVVSAETPNAREARLRYNVVQQSAGRCLIEVELLTGRMHQIRVQLAHAGAPVLGDTQYGGETWNPFEADTAASAEVTRDSAADDSTEIHSPVGVTTPRVIALHAVELTLLHPVRYDNLTIRAPVPSTWREFGFETEIHEGRAEPAE